MDTRLFDMGYKHKAWRNTQYKQVPPQLPGSNNCGFHISMLADHNFLKSRTQRMLRTILITFAVFFAISSGAPAKQLKSFVTQDKLGLELYRLSRNFDEKIKDAKKSLRDEIDKKIAIAERRLNGNLMPKVQSLTNRMNGAKVQCHYRRTDWNAYSNASIMFLDRQRVYCRPPYFLSSFRLTRRADSLQADVRYNYKCCKFVL